MENFQLDTDILIIGAGVIGLAVSRALSMSDFKTITIEKNKSIGSEISSRNSEVIHAGLYYPSGSLKAKHCIQGNKYLYKFCLEKNIPYKQCGKLIVATKKDDCAILENIFSNANECGVKDLKILSGKNANILEPELYCIEAIESPYSGIIDSHTFIQELNNDIINTDNIVSLESKLEAAYPENYGIRSKIQSQNDTINIKSKWIVNAAGLNSQSVAKSIYGFDKKYIPKRFLGKGTYFTISGKTPFSRLIYPVPDKDSLGTHFTIDLAGKGKFGPDLEWVKEIEYEVDELRKEKIFNTVSNYWPKANIERLQPGYTGIRPKISGPGEKANDFIIQGPDTHGINGLINLFGIESPGLTASMSLANHILGIIEN